MAWAALGVALLLSAWLVVGREPPGEPNGVRDQELVEEQAVPVHEPRAVNPVPTVVPTAASVPPLHAVASAAPLPSPSEEVATDGLPYMPADPNAPRPVGFVHPHPITPEHARIFRENATIQALNDAMDSRDVATLRSVLARYRNEYPEDEQRLQEGYELIANCLEHGASERSAAQRYFDEERGSSLRRFVLRYCLGGP